MQSENDSDDGENEMNTFGANEEEMTAMNYQNHRLAPAKVLEPTTAKYLLDFIYFTRDDEQFRFYKKVSNGTATESTFHDRRDRVKGHDTSSSIHRRLCSNLFH
jgi:hypothetical protein